ncbi:MAG: biopolymer transporter ExbD [Kiritimatiellae bacterium]|nr:biopolymer transporter ExbD [Kiritimatiellia bacterium]
MIRRKKRMSLIVPTSSMGDIAFLLIIFFMLASTFMKSGNVQVENPTSDSIEAQESPMVEVIVDADGAIWMGGVVSSVAEVGMACRMQAEQLRESPVHLKVDRNLKRKDYMPVIEAISEAGVKMILTGDKEN